MEAQAEASATIQRILQDPSATLPPLHALQFVPMTSAEQAPIQRNLQLEQLDTDLYRNARELWRPRNARGIFGGAVIGQALAAACETVPEGLLIHSLHSYFVLKGDETHPIVYHVERVRDGKSYVTRTVQARQRNRAIFTMTCSFHKPETSRLAHQVRFPRDTPPVDSLPTEGVLLDEQADKYQMSKAQRERLHETIEMSPTESRRIPKNYTENEEPAEKRQSIWMRAKGKISGNSNQHAVAASYFSDHWFLSTSLMMNNKTFFDASMMASLDHSIWFHKPFKADEWLLYEMESPWSGNGRGFNIGRMFTQDGELVAECVQEGLIRLKPEDSKPKL